MVGTVVGAAAVVALTAWFPQDRGPFLIGLALWGAGCTLVATLLKNFAAYAAALAGYTVAIIASDELGATGGPDGGAFMLAITRASEICIGIVSAEVILAATDFGGARRRLATLLSGISSEISGRFTRTLAMAETDFDDTQRVRRELARRVIALEPIIDEAFGKSSQLRYHSPVLQAAVDGLFAALSSWRAVSVHLRSLSADRAQRGAHAVLKQVPEELRSATENGGLGSGSGAGPARWIADPVGLRRICDRAVRRLIALPAASPSLRLLADQTAEALAGISHALNGLALLVADSARPTPRRSSVRLRVPDWLPALVNAGRAFVVIRRRRTVLDRDRMAERRLGCRLGCNRRDPAGAASGPRLRCRDCLHAWHGFSRGICGLGQIRPVAAGGHLFRVQHYYWPLPRAYGCTDCPAAASGIIHRDGREFRAPAGPHQRDELRYRTVLQ